jgi:putative transposase
MNLLLLLAHLLTTVARLLGPGGANAVIAENLLLKQQLLVISRARRRAPNLTALDRFLCGLWPLFINPRRLSKVAWKLCERRISLQRVRRQCR